MITVTYFLIRQFLKPSVQSSLLQNIYLTVFNSKYVYSEATLASFPLFKPIKYSPVSLCRKFNKDISGVKFCFATRNSFVPLSLESPLQSFPVIDLKMFCSRETQTALGSIRVLLLSMGSP